MRHDLRWLVVLLGNLVFLFMVSWANHYLARVDLGPLRGPAHLFALGLPVTFAALRLRLPQALAAVVPTALAFEASLPLPPGWLMLACVACTCVTIGLRSTFNRFEPTSALTAALLVNLALMLALTAIVRPAGGLTLAVRLATDLLLSQLLVAALCAWFFSWQLALLRVFGFNLETELREPL